MVALGDRSADRRPTKNSGMAGGELREFRIALMRGRDG
jgi:hypothetical protein